MPRPKNQMRTVQVTLSTNVTLLSLVDELVASGTFGKNRTEAIAELVSRHIRAAVEEVRRVPVKEVKT